jgi:hypothetical protein
VPAVIGDIVSLDLLVLGWFGLGLATLGLGIWAIVDAAGRPDYAFRAAGTSKGLWITLVVVLTLVCGPAGLIVSLVYLLSTRKRLIEVQASMPAPAYGGAPAPSGPVGWYSDPRSPGVEWWWDGRQYTGQRAAPLAAPPVPPPPVPPAPGAPPTAEPPSGPV